MFLVFQGSKFQSKQNEAEFFYWSFEKVHLQPAQNRPLIRQGWIWPLLASIYSSSVLDLNAIQNNSKFKSREPDVHLYAFWCSLNLKTLEFTVPPTDKVWRFVQKGKRFELDKKVQAGNLSTKVFLPGLPSAHSSSSRLTVYFTCAFFPACRATASLEYSGEF